MVARCGAITYAHGNSVASAFPVDRPKKHPSQRSPAMSVGGVNLEENGTMASSFSSLTSAAIIHTVGILALGGILLTAGTASAGECPAGKSGIDLTKPVTTPAKGVTDTVLGAIELDKEPAKIDGRLFRLRKLIVEPGGVVPWHSHANRPAIIYIVSGEIMEYASTCAVPLVHKAGDAVRETSATAHWWKNNGTQTVVLLSADLLPTGDDQHMMQRQAIN
jgi:quercetin dioxygenase-like cupin family protein